MGERIFSLNKILESYRGLGISSYSVLRTEDGKKLAKQIETLLKEEHPGKNALLIEFLNAKLGKSTNYDTFIKQLSEKNPVVLKKLYALGLKRRRNGKRNS